MKSQRELKTWLIFLLIIMNSLPIIHSSFTLPQLPPSHLHALLYPSHKPIFHSLTSTISSSKRRPSPFPLSSSFPLPQNSPPHLHILCHPTHHPILLIIFYLSLTSTSSSPSTHLPLPLSSFVLRQLYLNLLLMFIS